MMAGRRTTHGFARTERVAEQMRRDLAELLREIKDPRLAALLPFVSLTAVEVSNDYAHAKVYWTSLAGAEHESEIAAGLARVAGYLRRELGRRLHIHHIPELKFVFDASIERGSRLSRLIDEVVADVKKAHE
ncbi:MAG: 30S ribosome-binding factor RbfA [Rhodocyclaceae bacterium]|nr:30S ribosome-binding factor RbfA [Rhodocyclaceae bacterium]